MNCGNTHRSSNVAWNVWKSYAAAKNIVVDSKKISKDELNNVLKKFYAKVRKTDGSQYKKLGQAFVGYYLSRLNKLWYPPLACPECVPLTISYHLDFLRILKVWSICSVTGQWGDFRVKNATLCLHILFLDWLFFIKQNFFFFFWWFIKFPQHNIYHSKTGVGDKKLSVELYVNNCLLFGWAIELRNFH